MCRCAVPDWRALRLQLGWTAAEAGRRLGVSRHRIYQYEREPHRCPPVAVVKLLHVELHRSSAIATLRAQNFPNPFPPRPRPIGPICPSCGVPLSMHATCSECGALLGHVPLATPGVCPCGFVLVG